jgi:hypothetical protein
MSRTHEVAWAAGFFDGEGFISIQVRSSEKYEGHYLRIGVNHVAPEPLCELQRLFGGTVVPDKRPPIGNRKPRHRWVTSTSNAAEALKQMMPYFKNKNKVAEVALNFQATVQSNSEYHISDETLQLRRECAAELKRLNSLD